MPSPLVSIVMPCFNAGRTSQPALQSVVAQTHPAVEIIFVDSASTERKRTVAERVLRLSRDLSDRPMRNAGRQPREEPRLRLRERRLCELDGRRRPDGRRQDRASGRGARNRAGLRYRPTATGRCPEAAPRPIRRFCRVHTLRQVNDQLDRVLSGVWYPPHLYLLRRSAADGLQEAQAWHPERKVATDFEYSAIAALLGKSSFTCLARI